MEMRASTAVGDQYLLSIAFAAERRWLYAGGMDATLSVWDIDDLRPLGRFAAHEKSVNGVVLWPREDRALTCSSDGTVRVWALRGMQSEPVRVLQVRKQPVGAATVSPDGSLIAAAYYGGTLALWTAEGNPVRTHRTGSKHLTSVQFSPDGRLLACSGLAGTVWVYAVSDGELLAELPGHTAYAGFLHWHDNSHLTSFDHDCVWREFEIGDSQPRTMDDALVREVRFTPGARAIAVRPGTAHVALAYPGEVRVTGTDGKTAIADIPVSSPAISAMAWGPNGCCLAVATGDKRLSLYSV